jgi:regulatory protein
MARFRPADRDRKPRLPPQATEAYLRDWALRYLERYSASAAHLRRLMLVKVGRSRRAHGAEATADAEAVAAIVGKLTARGLLDDAAYAAGRARSLARRGASAQAIRAQLKAKGLSREDIGQALAGLEELAAEPELAAALAQARRRRLGPYRAPEERSERRERDLAALSRRGFDFETARRVIDADDLEALEQEAGAEPR